MHHSKAIIGGIGVTLTASLLIRRLIPNYRLNRMMNGNLKLFSTSKDRNLLHRLASNASSRYILKGWPSRGTGDPLKHRLIAAAASSTTDSAELESARLALLQPPLSAKKSTILEQHGDKREDFFYWHRDDDRKDKHVIAHLEAENSYTKAVLADTEALQEQLYKEMRGRIKEEDVSVPQRHDKHFYYTRTLEGQQYAVHCRRALSPAALALPPSENDTILTSNSDNATNQQSGEEEILLDENEEAAKHSFYMVGGFAVSQDEHLLAWGEDTKGNESYTLRVKDLRTGKELLAKPIPETAGNCCFANDNKTLFYVTKDAMDRPYKVWKHTVGSDNDEEDVLVYHETDESFYVGIGRSRSEKLITIHSGSAITSEVLILNADTPDGIFRPVLARKHDVEYSVDHRGQQLLVTIRDENRPNQEVLAIPFDITATINSPIVEDEREMSVLLPHSKAVQIEHIELSRDFLVSFERHQGLQQAIIHTLPPNNEDSPITPASLANGGQPVSFEEPAYELSCGSCGDYDSPILRLHYTSLTTPDTIFDYNMVSNNRKVKKVQPVLGGFDSSAYKTERLWAEAPSGHGDDNTDNDNNSDKVKVPISLVYRPDLIRLDGSNPLLLDAYGSYQSCNDPDFRSSRLSLIDRGFIFAIAHVRGGGELGRYWYEDGKFFKKKNTFTDFIACAEHLIANKYTTPSKLCIEGRSAGGLTMGAVITMRPDLFCAAVIGVGFLDCLTTMLDETIPLTVIEWEEWGNPVESRKVYDYMKSYSPLDNVLPAEYPHILATAGLHDPRVGYWEVSKFVARMRDAQLKEGNMLLLKCEMGAGHFSVSGRFERLKEVALEYAFLLKTQGMLERGLSPSGPASV